MEGLQIVGRRKDEDCKCWQTLGAASIGFDLIAAFNTRRRRRRSGARLLDGGSARYLGPPLREKTPTSRSIRSISRGTDCSKAKSSASRRTPLYARRRVQRLEPRKSRAPSLTQANRMGRNCFTLHACRWTKLTCRSTASSAIWLPAWLSLPKSKQERVASLSISCRYCFDIGTRA